ncbi:hypothetical protein JOF56_008544 [Kibdelosporangium banguiense]|uniref:Lipoprotein n=1 Tax=Kibdelosporangium banguiense TaxID=1365924 RepID=A0ABS4TUR3_9PSEU|nr:hypothetical protein [Kibdelosporangium banguiense]MBP2328159.1 hypothetical protein [Kibdelosporangium banguiense]
MTAGADRRLPVVLLLVLATIGACAHPKPDGGNNVVKPEGWREITLVDAVSFAVPPDAQAQDFQPVDSAFGVMRGPNYEVVYDYGRFGEDLTALTDKPEFVRTSREITGGTAAEVAFRGDGNPWGWVRILSTQQDESNHLTIRVSCVDVAACRLADDVFNSIRRI